MPVRIGLIGSFLLAASLAVAAQTAAPDTPTFTVSDYQVTGSNPLSVESTREILKQYTGEHTGLEGLQAAADALEQAMRAKGYSFHRVVLPPQTLRNGVVQLRVVEFPLDKIRVEGNRYFNDENIRNSLPGLKPGISPNLQRLQRGLRLANEHPARQLTVGFRESETAQAVDAVIKVQDHSPHTFFSALQNTGSEETGDYRLSLGYQYSNLFNRDHAVSIVYTTAPDETDAVSQVGVAYRLPVYSISSVFTLAYSDSDIESGLIDTGTTDTGDSTRFFNITGKGTAASLGYSYALPGTGRYQNDLKVSYEDKLFENNLFLSGDPVNPCTNKVRTNPFGVSYKGVLQGNNRVFGFSLGFFANQAGGSYSGDEYYECARPGVEASPDWSAVRYALNFNQRFGGDWMFALRFSGQSADGPLVPGEQFGLGGANSVRGYEERSILGDDGWQTNLEVWSPAFGGNSMHALVFYDVGHAESKVAGTDEPLTYDPAGAGIGFRWVWNNQLSLRTDVASTLKELDNFENVKKGDTTLHFSIYYRF